MSREEKVHVCCLQMHFATVNDKIFHSLHNSHIPPEFPITVFMGSA